MSPPTKRTRRQIATRSSDSSPSPQSKGQRVSWTIPHYCTRWTVQVSQRIRFPPARMSQRGEGSSNDHSHMNGHVGVKRSCQVKKSKFEHLNQSLLFDQLVNSTAEAVLQEMDNISSIRQNREVERLRMWTDTELENMDMYSRVKRRKSLRRNAYGMQTHHKVISKADRPEEEEEEEEGDEAEEAEEENDRPYNLRQRKTVQRYEAPPIGIPYKDCVTYLIFSEYFTMSMCTFFGRIKRHAIHSSDTTSSSDEERFERRKSKSMTRARNRCLPMNLRAEDLASGGLRDRVKVGASLADVDPMNLDTSVTFDSVGGLGNHIKALKEMVVFPLLYPEVFEKFKIQPPRGCLFYGPPGTGKTLVARALANECSQGDRKVSFFMRKGADCLSKWVGESERQLRLLFDQAYLMRPSIIFFDEIDGLAPVRSSRQDQIHSSIVSTLLALMDGLDSRGEIVVIGATNRIDSIDPALRRPGRFDREFLFNLPDKKARKHILGIHTRDWNPKLAESFVEELAEKCVGYCGADIKALCTEAALAALRRRYPQIYGASQRYKLDVGSIVLGPQDFERALRSIVPAAQRALAPPGRALPALLQPLLEATLAQVLHSVLRVFPHAEQDFCSEEENDTGAPSIYDVLSASPKKSSPSHKPFLHITTSAYAQPTSYRPRLLLTGPPGLGQSTHLAPAVLHRLENFSVHRLDLPTLYSVSAKTPEESCAQVLREARRSVPSVVYMPHINEWWEAISETVKNTFLTLLQDLPSFSPILILATAENSYTQLPEEVKLIFSRTYGEVVCLSTPGEEDRRKFFSDLILVQAARSPPQRRNTGRELEVLDLAETPGPRQLSAEEKQRLEEHEENTLRELRLFLRDVTRRLATDKRFVVFTKPVDIEEVSDYLEVIRQPMDLSTIMTKIDTQKYLVARDFLVDVDLICSNALEYNPDKDPGDKIIRHRACSLKDTAHAMIASELDPEFERMCEEIKESRHKRGNTHIHTQFRVGARMHRKGNHMKPGWFNSGCKRRNNQVKRKVRRRPTWGRGIIKKKKAYLKKETEDDEDADAEGEDAMDESGAAGIGEDEESSCDTIELSATAASTDNATAKHNGHALSTEEESSNEPIVISDPQENKGSGASNPQECLNGDESMSSLDSEVNRKDTEGSGGENETSALGHSGRTEETSARVSTQGGADACGVDSQSEHQTAVTAERPEDPPQPPPPPAVVVDHQRLAALLDEVVSRTAGFSVDQLERLYSQLSQCIYQHRRDYDKTLLIEASSTHHPFDYFTLVFQFSCNKLRANCLATLRQHLCRCS
uniref:ATPase family AAA domain-containing protein 2 n=1 Tax=Denticeps clupeoides TaxID=299321 RepID=A0AAY4AWR2_9TELE